MDEIAVLVGTRPSIVMFAPIIHELRRRCIPYFSIHTGQHYSPNMDSAFFDDLNLPQVDYRLDGVAQQSTHGRQTARMLEGIEDILIERRPRVLLVGGDANTNLAGALAARKLHVDVAHLEAGERSYDWCMPEEHNRIIIDHISDYLFVTGADGVERLKTESVRGQIVKTGNTIVDASLQHFDLAKEKSTILKDLNLEGSDFAVLTTHREHNVDDKDNLQGILLGVTQAAELANLDVLFPIHPRTAKRLREFGLEDWAAKLPRLRIIDALGYLDFLCLLGKSRLCFTDSGGVQQEACIHRIPAVTLRENTEWMATLEIGANRLAGTEPSRIVAAGCDAVRHNANWPVPFGDGKAAKYVIDCLEENVSKNGLVTKNVV